MLPGPFLLSVAAFLASAKFSTAQYPGYYGKYIGRLKTLHHSVSGEIFAVDARTLHIRDFTYDGEGPAAFFYAGNSKVPSASGFKINDEKGSPRPLQKYVKKHVTITLPDSKTLHNIKWFSVWCDEFAVNFGDIKIPKNLDYPRPQKIDALNGVHLVSSDPVVVVDAQTLLIPNFSYDGEAPDAKFWVGRGNRPSPQGIRVPDENGKEVPLRRYDRKTIVLTLPGDLTVFDIGHFGVWCEAFTVDFGHIRIPPGLNVPPSLKMLGVAPQKRARSLELAPDQIRKQLVFDNPEQHSFGGGTPSGEHSFFNNHYNNGNTFNRDQQQLSSFTGSSTNLDKQFVSGQQIQATTYKPTFNFHGPHPQNQPGLQHRQQPEIHTSFSSQAPTHQRHSSPSIEIVPSVSLSDSFNRESPPSQQTYNSAFQQPHDPRYYTNQQTQQHNAFLQTNPHHFNNQAINFQQQQQQQQQQQLLQLQLQLQQQQLLQEQNRHNKVAEARVYTNQVPNNHNNGRHFSRFSYHGPSGGQSFVQ